MLSIVRTSTKQPVLITSVEVPALSHNSSVLKVPTEFLLSFCILAAKGANLIRKNRNCSKDMGYYINCCRKRSRHFDNRTAMHFEQAHIVLSEQTLLGIPMPRSHHKKDSIKSAGGSSPTSFPKSSTLVESIEAWFTRMSKLKRDSGPYSTSSLYLFSINNRFRIFLINLCNSSIFNTLVDIAILNYNIRMLICCFQNTVVDQYDPTSISYGVVVLLNVLIRVIAFSLIGHQCSYILRDHFNVFEFGLAVVYFIQKLSFLQAFQLFRIIAILNRVKFLNVFARKTQIIKKSMLSLSIFVAIHLLLTFLFSLISYVAFHKEMSQYCVIADRGFNITNIDQIAGICLDDSDCGSGFACLDLTQVTNLSRSGYGLMNFKTLGNSFFTNFLITSLVNITMIIQELNLTGGGILSSFYMLIQILLFGFALKSFFVSILYDIIVNRHYDQHIDGFEDDSENNMAHIRKGVEDKNVSKQNPASLKEGNELLRTDTIQPKNKDIQDEPVLKKPNKDKMFVNLANKAREISLNLVMITRQKRENPSMGEYLCQRQSVLFSHLDLASLLLHQKPFD